MKRRAVLLAAIAALLALPALAPAAKPAPAPDRVQVRGSEYDLLLSRRKVKPGRVIVQFLNAGEDTHDLVVQRLDPGTGEQVGPVIGGQEVIPGAYVNLDSHLRKGSTYVLYCSLQNHRQLGMEATLRVARHRR